MVEHIGAVSAGPGVGVTSGASRLRFGLVGTGYWARHAHAAGLAAHPDVDLVGVWGRSASTTAEVASALGVPGYDRLDDLLADVDAVALAVPPDVQAGLAVQAAERGCHLLLDKPVALDVAAAERLAAAVATAGVAATVFFTVRYEPAVAAWLEQARGGWVAARVRVFSSVFGPGSPYAGSVWRRERGALWDLGPHALAVTTAVLGPVESVVARHGLDGATDIAVRHAGGATSSLSLSLTAPEAACGSEWAFYGERGAVSLPVPSPMTPQAYQACVDDVLRSVRTGQEPECGVRLGVDVVRALAAAQGSADAASPIG